MLFLLKFILIWLFSTSGNTINTQNEFNSQRFCLNTKYPCFYFLCSHLALNIDISKIHAYKCPKGLVFNEDKQKCEWVLPWLTCNDKLIPPNFNYNENDNAQNTHSYLYNMLKNVHQSQKNTKQLFNSFQSEASQTYLSSIGNNQPINYKSERVIIHESAYKKRANFTATGFDDLGEASQYAFIIVPVKVPSSQIQAEQFLSKNMTKMTTTTSKSKITMKIKDPKERVDKKKRIPYKKVCYVTSWSQYRPKPGYFIPEYIDPFLCTHIIYAFAYIDNVTLTVKTIDENDEDMYRRINNLKYKNPHLKTMLGIGGWNMESQEFSDMVSEQRSRIIFIYHAIKFIRYYGFDGIDLDWEFPADRGGRTQDKQMFTLFLRELKQAIDEEKLENNRERLIVSAAVAAGKERIDIGYEVAEISKVLDFINLMTFDFRGAWDLKTGLNAPLYGHLNDSLNEQYLNQDWSVNYWISKGCPPHKLVLGLPAYGRTFTLKNPYDNGLGAPSIDNGTMGNYTKTPGFLAYYECCELRKSKDWTQVWLSQSKSNYMFNNDQWVSYDDIKSFHLRTAYVVAKGLGGLFLWSLDQDDHSGQFCGMGSYPLVKNSMSLLMDYLPDSKIIHEDNENINDKQIEIKERLSSENYKFSCFNKRNGIYRDTNECDKYYLCENSILKTYSCPLGMKFNMKGCYCDDDDIFNFKCEQLSDTYCGREQDLSSFK